MARIHENMFPSLRLNGPSQLMTRNKIVVFEHGGPAVAFFSFLVLGLGCDMDLSLLPCPSNGEYIISCTGMRKFGEIPGV